MVTWKKETWNEANEINNYDIIIIGKYRFEYRINWIKLEDSNSEFTHIALKNILGSSWKRTIYDLWGDYIVSDIDHFTYTPTMCDEKYNKQLISLLMARVNENKDVDVEDEDEVNRMPCFWNKYNFEACDELKLSDTIDFGDNMKYDVHSSFLCLLTGGGNYKILEKTYGESYRKELSLLYGYQIKEGDWPVCKDGDYEALTRVMKNIFQCLYFGHDKPSVSTKLHSTPPVNRTFTFENNYVNLNDEPKLINSQVKISKITNVDALDKIKLL